jgi:hypothetical protein
MGKLVLTKIPDCEALIANDIRDWFATDQKFSELFPGQNLKVSTDHPFVSLLTQNVADGSSYDLSGFPSVTVIDTNFVKLVETPVLPQTMRLLPTLIDEIRAGGRNKFIMSKQALVALEQAFVGQQYLLAEGFQTLRRTQMAIEIWATNKIQKDKLFDLVSLYLVGQQRFKQHTENEIVIEEESINGERSGVYNFDFGDVLYGAMLHFNVAYTVGYFEIKTYTTVGTIDVVAHGMVGEE